MRFEKDIYRAWSKILSKGKDRVSIFVRRLIMSRWKSTFPVFSMDDSKSQARTKAPLDKDTLLFPFGGQRFMIILGSD